MHCILHHLFDRGMLMPKHRHGMLKRHVGQLLISEAKDTVRRRRTRLARLVCERDQDAILPLHDAEVVAIGPGYMVISGLERHEDILRPPIEYAQSWWVEFSSGPPAGWEAPRSPERFNSP